MNALSYIKNVGKSFGYSGLDYLKATNPAITTFAENAKELGEDLYQSIRDFKESNQNNSAEKSFKGMIKDGAKEIWTATKQDLMSGQWYNKARQEENTNAMMTSFMGEDFDLDFDFEFDDDSDTDVEVSTAKQSVSALSEAMDTVGGKISDTLTAATINSTEYIVNSSKQNTQALYAITNRGFGQLTKGISAVNSNISALVQLGQPLTAHMQNSTVFYTKSSEYYEKSLKLLEQIAKNTTSVSPEVTRSSGNKHTIDSLMSDGSLNLVAYADMVKENVKEAVSSITSILDVAGGTSGVVKMASGSPMKMVTDAAVKAMVPKMVKESMEMFNMTIEGFFKTMLGTSRDKSPFKSGSGLDSIWDLISDFILPRSDFKTTFDPGKYHKGKVDWDGMSRKALMEVIPTQLGKILSVLSGQEEERFDYEQGTWKKVSKIREKFEYTKSSKARSVGGEYIRYLETTVDNLNKQGKISGDQSKAYKQQINKYNETAFFSNSSDFVDIMKEDFDYQKYGLSKEAWDLIRAANETARKNKKRNLRAEYTGNIYTGRDDFGNYMRGAEVDGSNLAVNLFNGSITDDKKTRTLLGVDQYNNDIFFYLQGVYQHTKHVSDNLGVLAGGNGSYIQGTAVPETNAKIKPIKAITTRVTAEDKAKANAKYTSKNVNKFTMGDVDSAASSALNIEDELSLAPELQEYLDNKQKAIALGEKFKEDPNKEAQIKVFQKAHEDKNKFASKFKDSSVYKGITKVSDAISKIFKVPADAVTNLLDAAMVSMNKVMYGESYDDEKGIFGFFSSGMKKIFGRFDDWLSRITNGRVNMGEAAGKVGRFFFGDKQEDGSRSGGFASGLYNNTKDELKNVGRWTKDVFVGEAANGRRVSRSGVVSVSEGELIIPAEMNPFYHKMVNKDKQYTTEAINTERYFGSFAAGGTAGKGSTQDVPKSSYKDIVDQFRSYGKDAKTVVINLGKPGLEKLKEAGGTIFDRLFPKDPKKDENAVKKTSMDMMKEIASNNGAVGAGALIGAGASLLTGGLVGPIMGAGIGAAVGLTIRSKAMQDMLFGEIDEETGKRKGSKLIPAKISNFITQNVPSMAKGGLVGLTGGLFLGSPIMGALLGSTVGFVSRSEQAQKFLFGELDESGERTGGLISKKMQDMMKSAMPNMTAGAIAGLLAGPFGSPVMNLIAGSAVGYATTNNRFKDWLLGDLDEEDGKRHGGFLGFFKENLIDPIVGTFDKLAEAMHHTVRNVLHTVGKGIRTVFTNFIKGSIGKSAVGRFLGSAVGKVGNFVTKAPVAIAGAPFKAVNYLLEGSALKRGYSIKDRTLGRNLSAEERMQARGSHLIGNNSDYGQIDSIIAALSGDEEGLTQFSDLASRMYDPTKAYDSDLKKSRETLRIALANTGSPNAKDIYKKIKKNDYSGAIADVQNDPNINEAAKANIIQLIQQVETTYNDRKTAKTNTQAAKEALYDKSGIAGKLKSMGFDVNKLKDSDMRNIQDLVKDELNYNKSTKEAKTEEEKTSDYREEVLNKFDDILKILAGDPEAKKKYTKVDFGGIKDYTELGIRQEIDPITSNPVQYIADENGNLTLDNTDTATRETMEQKKGFLDGIAAVPFIGKAMGGMSNIFEKIKTSLFGEKEDEKETFFDKIKGFFSGGLSSILKTVVVGGIGALALNLFKNGDFSGLISAIKTAIGGTVDVVDTVSHKLGLTGAGTDDVELKYYGTDAEGNKVEVYKDPETGAYITGDGEAYTGSVTPEYVSTYSNEGMSLSERAVTSVARGAITGRRSALSLIPKIGSKIDDLLSPKTIASGIDDVSGAAAKVIPKITKAISKLKGLLMKTPLKDYVDEKVVGDMVEALGERASKSAAKSAAKSALSTVSKVLPIINAIAFVIDFTTGMQDASTVLGIQEENVGIGQRLMCGALRACKNLIPILGVLIPDSVFAEIFAKYIFPALGIDMSTYEAQQDEAQAELAAHNEKWGTDYTWEEYNKKVKGNYTWTESIVNTVKETYEMGKDGFTTLLGSISDWASDAVDSIKDAFTIKTVTESVPVVAAAGSGLISQTDPKIANIQVGNGTMADNGCGPATAAMAISKLTGGSSRLNQAIDVANQYQTVGGTDLNYFNDIYARNGVNANYYSPTSLAMKEDLSQGKPVILMGNDPNNTSKDKSPFGPKNHYVVADGYDNNGNLIISDPESTKPRKYSSNILKNVSIAIGGSGSRLNRYKKKLFGKGAGGSITLTANAQAVVSFFRQRGYSFAAIAGILGNMFAESNVDPGAIQSSQHAAGIVQWENYKEKSKRFKSLMDFAASMGANWNDMAAQLMFIDKELADTRDGYMKKLAKYYENRDAFKAADNPMHAARDFMIAYERPANKNSSKRENYALEYYKLIETNADNIDKFKQVTVNTSSLGLANDIDTGDSESSSGGILSKILSIFTEGLSSIFGGNEDDTDYTTTSNSATATSVNAVPLFNESDLGTGIISPVGVMKKLEEKLQYKYGADDVPGGKADCSATVRYAVKKATESLGEAVDIGRGTVNQYSNSLLTPVWYDNGKSPEDIPTNLMPNDILFFARRTKDYTKGRTDRVGHVGIYMGNGQFIDHGSGIGPRVKELNPTSQQFIKASRLSTGEIFNTGEETTFDSYTSDNAVLNSPQVASNLDTLATYMDENNSGSGSGLYNYKRGASGSRKLLLNSKSDLFINPKNNDTEFRPRRLYTGAGASSITSAPITSTKTTAKSTSTIKNSGISKDVAAILSVMLTLVEQLVSNTTSIGNIYELLKTMAGNSSAATVEAVNRLAAQNTSTDSGIQQSISTLKSTIDEILAS